GRVQQPFRDHRRADRAGADALQEIAARNALTFFVVHGDPPPWNVQVIRAIKALISRLVNSVFSAFERRKLTTNTHGSILADEMRMPALLAKIFAIVFCSSLFAPPLAAFAQPTETIEIRIAGGQKIVANISRGGPVPAEDLRIKIEVAGILVGPSKTNGREP